MRFIISFLITIVFSNFIPSVSVSDASAQTVQEMCPAPFEFSNISEFEGGQIGCFFPFQLFDSLDEAEVVLANGENECDLVNGTFFGVAQPEFTSGAPATGNFIASMSCTIPFDTSNTIFCPSTELVFFSEIGRTDNLVSCSANAFGQTQGEAEDNIFLVEAACAAAPNSTSNAGVANSFMFSGFNSFSATVTCDIQIPPPSLPPETDPLSVCPSPFEFAFLNQFSETINCGFNDTFSTFEEAEFEEEVGRDACSGVGIFSGGARSFAITGGADAGTFQNIMSCSIPFDISETVFCPTDNVSVFFGEVERTSGLLSCRSTSSFGADQQAAEDANAAAATLCQSIPNSVVSAEVIEFNSSGFTSFNGSVTCDIALTDPDPEFGPFGNGVVVRACDATCTEDIQETRICVNGDVGDSGCTGITTRIVTSSCNTGSEGLCPVITVAPIINLLLDEQEE